MRALFTIIFFTFSLWGQSNPKEFELWKAGRTYWYEKDWEKAAETYRQHIEQFPESPRRCNSENYLGYCYYSMGKLKEALDTFEGIIKEGKCKDEVLIDAKFKKLQIAFDLAKKGEPNYRKLLLQGLKDPNLDIQFQAAIQLSELGDRSGVGVFFNVLKKEQDQDRKDSAAKYILKMGTKEDKEALKKLLDEMQQANTGKKPKMVRLIIRDLKNQEERKVSLPISLFNVVIRSLTEDQIKTVEEQAGIDLHNLKINLEDLPAGHVLFKIIDNKQQEIKLFLE